jgi:hypothetical protein
MKRILLPILFFICANLCSVVWIETSISPVAAKDCPVQTVGSALDSPTNSERFFNQGQRQLEQEIQRLQKAPERENSELLKIDPTILQQQRDLQQLEHSLNGVVRVTEVLQKK